MTCTDCQKTYQAYLCDIPSTWREQIADLMCKVVADVDVVTCDKVRECETLTTLSPFNIEDDTLCITYTDERGVSIERCIEIPSFGGDFIQNQFAAVQGAEFWVSGRTRVGNLDVTSATLPSNGLTSPTANTLGIVAGGALVTTITSALGLMTHKGNIFLDASISSAPAISFFLNSLAGSDYFIQRVGTTLDIHAAGLVQLSANTGKGYNMNSNPNRGHEWFSMESPTNNTLMQLFPEGGLLLKTTTVQQSPEPSAMIEIDSTTRGFLNSRMTTAQKMAIASPQPGLVVFDTDLQKLCVYTTIWETIISV